MNRDTMGQSLTLTLFGESHGPAVGCVVQGLAPGLEIDLNFMARQLQRRKGAAALSTGRREGDAPQVLSGAYQPGPHHRHGPVPADPQPGYPQQGLWEPLGHPPARPWGLYGPGQIPKL